MITEESTLPLQAEAGDEQTSKCHVLLFVVEGGINSQHAILNLKKLCAQFPPGEFDIQIIDVANDFEIALKHNVLVTPCSIIIRPPLHLMILGDLSNSEELLSALGRGAGDNGHQQH